MGAVREWSRLAEFLVREEAADRFSGTVVVEHRGEVAFAGAYGEAHKGLAVRNEIDTRLNAASITKMFTTVAVLQLVEQDAVSLHATVAEVVPDVAIGMAERITVHHLLSHQSGLGDYWNQKCQERRSTLRTTEDYLALIEGEQPSFEPGTSTHYGNSGHLVLAAVIERVTGVDYYDYVREHVCRRGGAERATHLHLDHVEDFAHGYTHVEWEGSAHPDYWTDNIFQYPVRGSGATGIYSSAPDLIRFGLELRGGTLLRESSRALMLAPPEDGGRGYGTQRVPYSQGVAVGHGGRAFGAASLLLFLPESRLSVCILSNYDRPADKTVFAEIDRNLAG